VLANLLRAGEGAGTGDSDFDRLLSHLLAHGIGYHAPVDGLWQWTECLEREHSGAAVAAMKASAGRLLMTDKGMSNAWARAVALVTLYSVRHSCLKEVKPGVPLASEEQLCASLESLFRSEAREDRAGPIAFSWIVRAALRLPEVRHKAGPELQRYYRRLSLAAAASPARDFRAAGREYSSSAEVDRVSAFLGRPVIVAPEQPEAPLVWTPETCVAHSDTVAPGEIRIAVVGGPQSGKSSLARALGDAWRRVVADALAAGGVSGAHDGSPEIRYYGTIDGQRFQIVIVEAPVAAGVSPSPQQARAQAPLRLDLIVAVLEPTDMDGRGSSSLPSVLDYCARALDSRPQTRIAVAYTKSDEYGVIDENAIRLIGLPAHAEALQRWRAEAGEVHWEQFVRPGLSDRASVRREGMANFSRNLKAGSADAEWCETRAWVLRQSRAIWEFGLRRHPIALVNGYFISSDSRDPYLKLAGLTGVVQMMADLLQVFKLSSAALTAGRRACQGPARTPKNTLGRGELG
jgi:hypothetical protein